MLACGIAFFPSCVVRLHSTTRQQLGIGVSFGMTRLCVSAVQELQGAIAQTNTTTLGPGMTVTAVKRAPLAAPLSQAHLKSPALEALKVGDWMHMDGSELPQRPCYRTHMLVDY